MDGMNGMDDFLKFLASQGMGPGEAPSNPAEMLEMMKAFKHQVAEEKLNLIVEEQDVNNLVSMLTGSECEMSLDAPVFLSPGDVLVRLTDDEIELANLKPFPYRYPRPGQPVQVIKIISDPTPNNSGSIEDFVAKVNLYEVDCDSCEHRDTDHGEGAVCQIRVKATLPYTMNSRYFKFYLE